MAAKRKASNFSKKISDLTLLGIIFLALYASVRPKYGSLFFGFLSFVIFMTWVLFFIPTKCDFALWSRPRPCDSNVRGKLRGCTWRNHDRPKRDAVWAAFNMRNPGQIFRVLWVPERVNWRPAGSRGGGRATAGPSPGPSRQTASEVIMLAATVIGALAAVLALFIH